MSKKYLCRKYVAACEAMFRRINGTAKPRRRRWRKFVSALNELMAYNRKKYGDRAK